MGVVQIQTDIKYKHKHNHESHMKAQTSRQQADIQDTRRQLQTHEHMKAQTSRQQADIQDTRRQHQTHECIGTRQTHKTQDTSTSTIMRHTCKHKQTGSKQTYKTQEEPLQIQECIGAYKTQEDKTDTKRQQQTQECIGVTLDNISIAIRLHIQMHMHASQHTCLHHAHSHFGSIQVHPLLLAQCQNFHKLPQMQYKLSMNFCKQMMQTILSLLHQLSLIQMLFQLIQIHTKIAENLMMQPIHSLIHQLHLLFHWAQHQMKIMKNWEMWWSKYVVHATIRRLWGSHHTEPSARSSQHRIGNWRMTGQLCSNNARIGEQNAWALQTQHHQRGPPKRTTKASSSTKGPSRCTRKKMHLRESTNLQAQGPCSKKCQLVRHPVIPPRCSRRQRGGLLAAEDD